VFQELEATRFHGSRHRPPLLPRKYSWYLFLLNLSRSQGHSAAGRIMSRKDYSDTIGNRNRDIPVRSAVPQTTGPPCASRRLVLLIGMPRRSIRQRNGSESVGSQQPIALTSHQSDNKEAVNQHRSSTKRSTFALSARIPSQPVRQQTVLSPPCLSPNLLTDPITRTVVGCSDVLARFQTRQMCCTYVQNVFMLSRAQGERRHYRQLRGNKWAVLSEGSVSYCVNVSVCVVWSSHKIC